jgi:hypothetical protein
MSASRRWRFTLLCPLLFGAACSAPGVGVDDPRDHVGGSSDGASPAGAGAGAIAGGGGASAAGGGGSGVRGLAASGGGGSEAPVIACDDLAPPQRGLRVRFVASHGVELEAGGVRRWRNMVESGPAAEQIEPERRPSVLTDQLNGQSVVHLDGANDYLAFDFPVSGKTELTLAAVSRTWEYQSGSPNPDCGERIGRELNCSGTDQSLLCWTEEGNAFTEQGIFWGVGQREATFRFGTGDAYPHYKTPFVLEQPNEARFVFGLALLQGSERKLFLNGSVPRGRPNYETDELLALETRANGGAVRAEPTAWIGKGRFNPATSFWAGDLAELFVYDAALDDLERVELEAYVKCAYFPDGY